MSQPKYLRQLDFFIGWIFILEIEYCAAMDVLDEEYGTNHEAGFISGKGDRNTYKLGRIGGHNVVINRPHSGISGQLTAFQIAASMKSTFPCIRFVFLVGIGGGAPSQQVDVRLGDVVLGTSVVPYQKGKAMDRHFEITGIKQTPPLELLDAVTELKYRLRRGPSLEQIIDELFRQKVGQRDMYPRPAEDRLLLSEYLHEGKTCLCGRQEIRDVSKLVKREKRPPRQLIRAHCGTIGSADQVMKNAKLRDHLSREENIICFEMEAAAVMHTTRCIPVRGISDYSDGHKNDVWHDYAALSAAICARELLKWLSPDSVLSTTIELTLDELRRLIEGSVEGIMMKIDQSLHFQNLENISMAMMEANLAIRELIDFIKKFTTQQQTNTDRTSICMLIGFQKQIQGLVYYIQTDIKFKITSACYLALQGREELKQQLDKTARDVAELRTYPRQVWHSLLDVEPELPPWCHMRKT
ncbi:hypothetical protein FBEOM_4894 [Fusarium beomiforme]|uniref:Nucleoside phosphorylase domain-containing protein n=1 Tax=Fusarium beomiforme TaxID=44412 RepID=A0A9P5AM68_9HYPO|nr:hypothetical protein FBEOM_4894 [Fusarium beomiforme]